jgi:predicted HicB family RNase H-like nuclease
MKVQIRDVPDEVHRILKHEAIDRGCPLNTLLIEILTKAVEKIAGKAGRA